MDARSRFFRALEVPDGVIRTEAKARHAAQRLLVKTTFVEDNEVLAEHTASLCVEHLATLYEAGALDDVLIGHESSNHAAVRIAADLTAGDLREKLAGKGATRQPTKGVPEQVVAAVIDKLVAYVHGNPVDSN